MLLPSLYEIAAPDVISETVDGEVLIINLATGVYYRGDSQAAVIWNAIVSGAPLNELVNGDQAGVVMFVETLIAEGLIRQRNEPATAAATTRPITVAGVPSLEKFEDLQDMLALDPIHDVDPSIGWPSQR